MLGLDAIGGVDVSNLDIVTIFDLPDIFSTAREVQLVTSTSFDSSIYVLAFLAVHASPCTADQRMLPFFISSRRLRLDFSTVASRVVTPDVLCLQ